eukprot:1033581-Prymnesium_polylepis.2
MCGRQSHGEAARAVSARRGSPCQDVQTRLTVGRAATRYVLWNYGLSACAQLPPARGVGVRLERPDLGIARNEDAC